MSLIVAPAAGFDALVIVDWADAYHASHGHLAWASVSADGKEAAIRQATQYIIGRGVKPQFIDPVHANVQAATAEAALRAAAGTLYADLDPQSIISETVGPISTTYGQPRNGGRMAFPIIDDLLRGLTDGQWNLRVNRA